MNIIHRLPYSMAAAAISNVDYGDKIVYLGKVYSSVPLNSPVFKYPLYEEDINNQNVPSFENEPQPVELIRLQHPRYDTLLLYKKNGEIVKSNIELHLSGYVPYEWIAVLFEHNNEIKWYYKQ